MSTSKRFKPIQNLADRKEHKAASALGVAIKSRDAAEKQLHDLRSYHADYLQRFYHSTQQGMGGARLHEYQLFLDKLEQAIAAQELALQEIEATCASSKTQWQKSYTKKQAMANAVERMQQDERQTAEHNEQKLADDRTTDKH